MKDSLPVFSALSIVDSVAVLVLLAVVALPPHPMGLVPWAGVLAGLNAVLLSWGLEFLDPRVRRGLRWVGGTAALVLAGLGIFSTFG
jgi:hypothetical protein